MDQIGVGEFVHITLADRIRCVLKVVEDETGIKKEEIAGNSRHKATVVARHVAWRVAKEISPGPSMSKLAYLFRRDHSSFLHAMSRFDDGEPQRQDLYHRVYPRVLEVLRGMPFVEKRVPRIEIKRKTESKVDPVLTSERTVTPVSKTGYIDRTGAIICLP